MTVSGSRPAAELLTLARKRLAENATADPRDARLLLGHVLGKSEAQTLAMGNDLVEAAGSIRFLELVDRRASGEPYAYITGQREFFDRSFQVDPRVLIPRPETEHLVETVLDLDLPQASVVLDVGTGSGCIALTLAAERPDLRVLGADSSLSALALAATNRQALRLTDQVDLLAGDLVQAVDPLQVRLLVSNPPYVDPADHLATEVRDHEPHAALFPHPTRDAPDKLEPNPDLALDVYRRFLEGRPPYRAGTDLCFEIGFGQSESIVSLAHPGYELVETRADLAGIPRVLHFRVR